METSKPNSSDSNSPAESASESDSRAWAAGGPEPRRGRERRQPRRPAGYTLISTDPFADE